MKTFYLLPLALCLVLFAACGDAHKPVATPLGDACAYLWKQQKPDGSWHSPNYAVLRSGQAYTPFVLHALLQVPDSVCPRPAGAIDRALDFIVACTDSNGCVGMADPDILEYPNYATAYALRCLALAGRRQDTAVIRRMKAYLLGQQFTAGRGFDTTMPAYGGWGFGALDLKKGETGHCDVAHLRRILQALRQAGAADTVVCRSALYFLRYVQRHPSERREQPDIPMEKPHSRRVPYDGGFYYSPVVLGANKGQHVHGTDTNDAYFRSYATPTCDGLLALLAAGLPATDERVGAARRWLAEHPLLERPEGIPVETDNDEWHMALHYYHIMVRSEVYSALGWEGDWRKKITALLAAEQNPDGSFTNKHSVLMKEDDPILATSFAVTALAGTLVK